MTIRRKPRKRGLWSLGLAAVAAFLPADARANPAARLVYGRGAGAEHCPDEATLRREVAKRVGYDPFFPHAPRSVVLTIFGRNDGLAARVDLVEEERAAASREIVTAGRDCEELFQSAALAIAIAIDPHALIKPSAPVADEKVEQEEPRHEAPELEQHDLPEIAPPSLAPAESEPKERVTTAAMNAGTKFRIALGPRMSSGLQPGATAGAFANAAAVWRYFSLGTEVGGYLPTTTTSPTSNAAASAWSAAASLVPCVRWETFHGCAVVTAGRLEVSGERSTGGTTRASAFLVTGARAGLDFPLARHITIALDGDLLGNLSRTTVKIGPERVWKASPFALALGTAVAIEL